MPKHALAAGAALGALALAAAAPETVRLGPPPGGTVQYRVDASTYSGFGAQFMTVRPTLGGILGAAVGGGARGGPAHMLTLTLGSNRPSDGAPSAEHVPPPGLGAGPSLPLITPEPVRSEPGREGGADPAEPGQPKGRILLFWGCGEAARPGQPLVLDLARLGAGAMNDQVRAYAQMRRRMAGAMGGAGAAMGAGAKAGFNHAAYRTVGEWPNSRTRRQVPGDGSLVGEHVVRSSYSPEIRFVLAPGQDFLDPFRFSRNGPAPSGAVAMEWAPIPSALAYSAVAFGGGQDQFVIWSSSDTQSGLGADAGASAAEIARLIQARVLLSPQTTRCAVPAEAVRAMGDGGLLMMNALGPQYAFSAPPRPPRALKSWAPDWTVRVDARATYMGLVGRETPGMGDDEERRREDRPRRRRNPLGLPF